MGTPKQAVWIQHAHLSSHNFRDPALRYKRQIFTTEYIKSYKILLIKRLRPPCTLLSWDGRHPGSGPEGAHHPHHVLPAEGALGHLLTTLSARHHVPALQQDAVDCMIHADLANHFFRQIFKFFARDAVVFPQDLDFVEQLRLLPHSRVVHSVQGEELLALPHTQLVDLLLRFQVPQVYNAGQYPFVGLRRRHGRGGG